MKAFTDRLQRTPTLFLVFGIPAVIYCIIKIIWSIQLPGGESLLALVYALYLLIAIGALSLDFILISYINFKIVSIVEIFVIVFVWLIFSYSTRQVILNIQGSNKPYLILIDDPNGISLSQLHSSGLFNKELTIKEDIFNINKDSFRGYTLRYDVPESWSGYSENPKYKPEYLFEWEFISSNNSKSYSDNEQDSLLKSKLSAAKIIHNPQFKGY